MLETCFSQPTARLLAPNSQPCCSKSEGGNCQARRVGSCRGRRLARRKRVLPAACKAAAHRPGRPRAYELSWLLSSLSPLVSAFSYFPDPFQPGMARTSTPASTATAATTTTVTRPAVRRRVANSGGSSSR